MSDSDLRDPWNTLHDMCIPPSPYKGAEQRHRESTRLPTDASARKGIPLARGLLDYFPDALCEVAKLSLAANEQHHPGTPVHWDKAKSTDEADALMRHLIARGKFDKDGQRHSAKVAWRGLALLQREIDAERAKL